MLHGDGRLSFQQQEWEKPGVGLWVSQAHNVSGKRGCERARGGAQHPPFSFLGWGALWKGERRGRMVKWAAWKQNGGRWKESSSQLLIDFSASLLIWG